MKKATQLKRLFLLRDVLSKGFQEYTEVETNVLIGIYLMNDKSERCSCNTLIEYLSKIHRTPNKENLFSTIQKFKRDEIIRITGNGPGTKIEITIGGKLYLFRLEEKIRRVRFCKVQKFIKKPLRLPQGSTITGLC